MRADVTGTVDGTAGRDRRCCVYAKGVGDVRGLAIVGVVDRIVTEAVLSIARNGEGVSGDEGT